MLFLRFSLSPTTGEWRPSTEIKLIESNLQKRPITPEIGTKQIRLLYKRLFLTEADNMSFYEKKRRRYCSISQHSFLLLNPLHSPSLINGSVGSSDSIILLFVFLPSDHTQLRNNKWRKKILWALCRWKRVLCRKVNSGLILGQRWYVRWIFKNNSNWIYRNKFEYLIIFFVKNETGEDYQYQFHVKGSSFSSMPIVFPILMSSFLSSNTLTVHFHTLEIMR